MPDRKYDPLKAASRSAEDALDSLTYGMSDARQNSLRRQELVQELSRRTKQKYDQYRFTTGTNFSFAHSDGTGMNVDRSERRILSQPVPVHWQGWETNTVRLQRSGWQLAVEFDPSRETYTLMMKHTEMKLTAITNAIRLAHSLSTFQQVYDINPAPGVNPMPTFNVVRIAPSIENVRIESNASWENFQLIDAEPQIVETRIERIEDLNIFALALGNAEQVVIDKADMNVVDHLQAIKDLQSDRQKELRDKARRSDSNVAGEVVVQLVDYK